MDPPIKHVRMFSRLFFILKLLFLLLLGCLTCVLYLRLHYLSKQQLQFSPVLRIHHDMRSNPVPNFRLPAPSFEHLSKKPSPSSCQVSSNFPRSQLMVIDDKNISVNQLLCNQLINGNVTLEQELRVSLKHWKTSLDDRKFLRSLYSNCTKTYEDFTRSWYISEDELQFPIAYEMLIYFKKSRIQQYFRLLKNIYRRNNFYCIHIDKKSPFEWTKLVRKVASCFPNVIVTKQQIKVEYARSSILYAHFECFKELTSQSMNWRYVISLHGTELPLTTNREIITFLQKLNGSNVISKGVNAKDLKGKSGKWLTYKVKSTYQGRWVELTNVTLGHIPYNMSVYKSAASANSAFSREFIEFILTDKRSIAFNQFLSDVHSGVEFFFSTMNALPDAPGGFNTIINEDLLPLVAQRDWVHDIIRNPSICKGRKIVHDICIVSSSDLPRLYKASQNKLWLFHNKYFMDYDHVVIDCIEKELLLRNYHEYIQDCFRETVIRVY